MFNVPVTPISSDVNELGIHIDSTLECRTHVSNVSRKFTGTLKISVMSKKLSYRSNRLNIVTRNRRDNSHLCIRSSRTALM